MQGRESWQKKENEEGKKEIPPLCSAVSYTQQRLTGEIKFQSKRDTNPQGNGKECGCIFYDIGTLLLLAQRSPLIQGHTLGRLDDAHLGITNQPPSAPFTLSSAHSMSHILFSAMTPAPGHIVGTQY